MKRQRSDDSCVNELTKGKDLVEDVRGCAITVAQELKASYDASIYYDALEIVLCEKFKGCGMVVKRGLTVPIGIFGHKHLLGNIKIPLAICDAMDDMRPVVLLEIKAKKAVAENRGWSSQNSRRATRRTVQSSRDGGPSRGTGRDVRGAGRGNDASR